MQQPRKPAKPFLNFNLQQLKESRQGAWFAVDLLMLMLLIVNLHLIVLDSLYRVDLVAGLLNEMIPFAQPALEGLNKHFFAIDLVFVLIFLTEFMVRWLVAVRQNTYRRWFFYPFIHFYDLLGCIPLGSFRALRFLRVFSIIYRLHKYRIIDVRQSAIFRFVVFYYEVFMEELSDRVVIKVITGIQEDLASDSHMGQQVVERLIAPRLTRLENAARAVTLRLSLAMQQEPDHPFAVSLRNSVLAAMQGNEELRRVAALPMFGTVINKRLEDLVAEIVVDTVATLVEQSHAFLRPGTLRVIADSKDESWSALDKELLDLIQEILEMMKEQMGQKSWKRKLDEAAADKN
jgi:hypothetical protein